MMQRPPLRPSFAPRRPAGSSGDGRPVLAVGGRVLVTASGGAARVPLSDDAGIPTGLSLPPGVEVEIVAWRPRGPSGPRYRVRWATDGIEGWVDAPSVHARPLPAPPPRPPAPAARRPEVPARARGSR